MIQLDGNKLGIAIRKPGDAWPTVILIDRAEDKYHLHLYDSDGAHVTNDIFDHLYEALDSMTGMVKTLEKEITTCSSLLEL